MGQISNKLSKIKILNGVYWVCAPEAQLSILCGCPADSVKHLIRLGLIVPSETDGVACETGPNAILLSDRLLQNSQFSNLSEFPVLQMLYRQGMMLPGHPNNKGLKPLLIGSEDQVNAQKAYIYRGNYGLVSERELMSAGMDAASAKMMMRIKLKFAFGKIKKTDELLDSRVVTDTPVEIRNGLFIRRTAFNVFEFQYANQRVSVDLNIEKGEVYEAPYSLSYHHISRDYFSVIHCGEGDGWDIERPCMGSILMFQGRIYLIDAGPNMADILTHLGIDPSEIEGIFHTHGHDDHFAGLPTLMRTDRKMKYFSTPVVRLSVIKKLSALMSIPESAFEDYFEINDLRCDEWNDICGLEVKPVISPHPVETTIFKFRAFWADGYRTYHHLADIAGKDVLLSMITGDSSETGISQDHFNRIINDYLEFSDLKKIDIGGGMIHGNATDFKKDESRKIVLAHKAEPLTKQEKAIGSNATFGAVDVLIATNRDYMKIKAKDCLDMQFPHCPDPVKEILLNCPIVSFNPGSVIFKNTNTTENKNVYIILTGTVEYIDSEMDVQKTLSTGSLVGDMDILENFELSGTFRAASYIHALKFNEDLYRFVMKNQGCGRPQ